MAGVIARELVPPKAKVTLLRPQGDPEPLDTATADARGTVAFDGLNEGDRVVLSFDGYDGETKRVTMTAKPESKDLTAHLRAVRFQREEEERPERPDTAPEGEQAPFLNINDVPEGTVLMSDTAHGEGHPVEDNVGEKAPRISQENVPEGTVQRSDTEKGYATIIPPDQVLSQEEANERGLVQRSSTPLGQAAIIPQGNAVEIQRDKESPTGAALAGTAEAAAVKPPKVASVDTTKPATKLTKDEIKSELDSRGVEYAASASKDDLVKALRKARRG